ncbi:MAG: hypothetical protein CR991_09360 [Proteobacteria bacterium]|nr:MAG: hypothetical protein CR991_09360 [Pseudomonadota bacterium]
MKHNKFRQKGITLLFALIILLVLSLLALASIRGVTLQERMASNLYDRDLAFQSAAAALKAAETQLAVNPTPMGMIDCTLVGVDCPVIPESTFTQENKGWLNVNDNYNINTETRPGTPQYQMQMTDASQAISLYGQERNAKNLQYGTHSGMLDSYFYRITVRSSNPTDAEGRALVVLQSTLKRENN